MKQDFTITDKTDEAIRFISKLANDETKSWSLSAVEHIRDRAPVLTGTLKASVTNLNEGELSGTLLTRTGYGAYPELGTANQAATPYFAPGVQASVADMQKIVDASSGRFRT